MVNEDPWDTVVGQERAVEVLRAALERPVRDDGVDEHMVIGTRVSSGLMDTGTSGNAR